MRRDEALKATHAAVDCRQGHPRAPTPSGCYLQTDLLSTSGDLPLVDASGTETRQALSHMVGAEFFQKSRPDDLPIIRSLGAPVQGRYLPCSVRGQGTAPYALKSSTLCCQGAYIVELKVRHQRSGTLCRTQGGSDTTSSPHKQAGEPRLHQSTIAAHHCRQLRHDPEGNRATLG